MKPTSTISALLAVFTLAGCVSVGKVSALDSDTLFITSSTTAGAITSGELLEKGTEQANQYCAKSGRDAHVVGTDLTHRGLGGRDMLIKFRCTDR